MVTWLGSIIVARIRKNKTRDPINRFLANAYPVKALSDTDRITVLAATITLFWSQCSGWMVRIEKRLLQFPSDGGDGNHSGGIWITPFCNFNEPVNIQ